MIPAHEATLSLSKVGDFFQERYSLRSAGSMYFIGDCSSPDDVDPLDEHSDEDADCAPELTSTRDDCGEFCKEN